MALSWLSTHTHTHTHPHTHTQTHRHTHTRTHTPPARCCPPGCVATASWTPVINDAVALAVATSGGPFQQCAAATPTVYTYVVGSAHLLGPLRMWRNPAIHAGCIHNPAHCSVVKKTIQRAAVPRLNDEEKINASKALDLVAPTEMTGAHILCTTPCSAAHAHAHTLLRTHGAGQHDCGGCQVERHNPRQLFSCHPVSQLPGRRLDQVLVHIQSWCRPDSQLCGVWW